MRGLWALFLAILTFKLWLVARDEVRASPPFQDPLRYAQMADALLQGRWLGDYDQLTLMRKPGYSFWVALVARTGLPLRIAAELFLAFGAAVLALVLVRQGLRAPLAAPLVYTSFVLEPHSFHINRELLSESFYSPALAVFAALLILAHARGACRQGAYWAAVSGIPLAALWHTRPEGVTLIAAVVAAGLLSFAFVPQGPRSWLSAFRSLAVLAGPPILVLALASAALAWTNHARYGVFTTLEMKSAGFVAAHRALMRIDVGPRRRYVAVPEAARRAAYAASPTFVLLQPYLEGPWRSAWLKNACYSGVCDDYGNGWFVYVLRDAAHSVGAHASAPEAEAFYWRIARELQGACGDGRLRCRRDWPGLLAVDPLGTFKAMPAAVVRTLRLFVTGYPIGRREEPGAAPAVKAVFDRVANRRIRLARPEQVGVVGWAFGPAGAPTLVEWRGGNGHELARSDTRLERPDVLLHFERLGITAPGRTGFKLATHVPAARGWSEGSFLLFYFADSSQHRVLARQGGCVDADCAVRYALDAVDDLDESDRALDVGWRHAIQGWIDRAYRAGLAVALPAGILLVVWAVLTRRRPSAALGSALLLLAFMLASRVFFFAYVDAAMFPAEVRYVYPVAPFVVILLLGAAQVALRPARAITTRG
jgi:hypothetical protein